MATRWTGPVSDGSALGGALAQEEASGCHGAEDGVSVPLSGTRLLTALGPHAETRPPHPGCDLPGGAGALHLAVAQAQQLHTHRQA